jgi:putative ATP-dependent DNA ligase
MTRDWTEVFGVADSEDLFEHFERDTFRGRHYRHMSDSRHGIERGTVVFDEVVVRGFPSIPRALVLETGVQAHFDGPVTIEEKLNGYNVRVARVDGDVLAFTRSGFICPYTTDKIRALLDADAFFDDHPELLLCGELLGPENPYTAHDYPDVEEATFRVFDLRHRETGAPVDVETRRERCRQYGLDQVPDYGVHDPGGAVVAAREAIDDLDERGREGVVLKSTDGRRQLKYTTSAIHRSDLSYAFSLPFDYGRDFLFARIIREAFQAVEFEESPAKARERARKLGEALLLPAVGTIRAVQTGETVGEEHVVRGDPDTIAELLGQFRGLGIDLVIERDETVDGERVVEFTKVSHSTRDKIDYYLDGGTIDE